MKNLILILITLAATATPTANAGTKAFGAELNVTTIDTLSDIAEVKEVGTNPVTNGKVFETKSNQFGVEGFIKVTYIFTEDGKLAGINALLNKGAFNNVNNAIAQKYKTVESRTPYVGDKYARFKTSDGAILLNAPHLSFEMDAIYLTQAFERAIKNKMQSEQNQKRRNEQTAF